MAVQKSGPLPRLDAKISEIKTGLDAVQSRLKNKFPSVTEAESAQKVLLAHFTSNHIQFGMPVFIHSMYPNFLCKECKKSDFDTKYIK